VGQAGVDLSLKKRPMSRCMTRVVDRLRSKYSVIEVFRLRYFKLQYFQTALIDCSFTPA
jgi:hypothetical protein